MPVSSNSLGDLPFTEYNEGATSFTGAISMPSSSISRMSGSQPEEAGASPAGGANFMSL